MLTLIVCSMAFLIGFAAVGRISTVRNDRARMVEYQELSESLYPFLDAEKYDEMHRSSKKAEIPTILAA